MPNRTFITGDTHGPVEMNRLSNKNFPTARELGLSDVIIICGDGGFMWNNSPEIEYWDTWAEERKFTIVSCFGNHENYDAIRALPQEEWCGGIVRKVRPHVMYLENGEIFNINGHSFFVMGGATSIDKAYRKEHISWWKEEIPSNKEMEHAAENLEKHNFEVDYIITHCGPNYIVDKLCPYSSSHDDITSFLEKYVRANVKFKAWYMGHYHQDRSFDNFKYNVMYNDIMEIKG